MAPETKTADASKGGDRSVLEILQLLYRHDGWLGRVHLGSDVAWQLFMPSQQGARLLRTVDPALVQRLRQDGLVMADAAEERQVSRLTLSRRGYSLLRCRMPQVIGVASAAAVDGSDDAMMQDARQATDAATPSPDATSAQGGRRKQSSASRAGARRGGRNRCGKTDHAHGRERQRLLIRDAESGRLREVEVNVRENPLMWLARRKDASGRPYLEPHHVAAGERLRQDYEIACMQPHVTASWNPALVAADRGRLKSGPRDPFPFAERVVAARQRVRRALEAIGDDLADVVSAVCCLEQGIEAAERHLNWPRRSARLVLRIALERLARHYGLRPAQERRGGASGGWQRALHWHADDGLPTELMPQPQADEAAGGNT